MFNTKSFILNGLRKYGLSDLPGRPYDNSFELLDSPPSRKKIVMVGFNGSLADVRNTNEEAIENDFHSPTSSNIQNGIEGKWGITHLAKRLQQIPGELGYDWNDTIYTNAILMCSRNAFSISKCAKEHNILLEDLVKKSLGFFNEITMAISEPDVIVAYSNSLTSLSSASLLLKYFGDRTTLNYSQNTGYYTTYSFKANFNHHEVPVVCVRHMSRFKPKIEYIKEALNLVG